MKICNRNSNICAALLLIFLITGAVAVRYGEKIPVNEGLGWDGRHYVRWATNLTEGLQDKEIPNYYIKRIMPIAVIHLALRVSRVETNVESIILLFGLMNLALLFLTGIIWLRIARLLEFSLINTLLSLSSLLFNFAVLKMSFYYPVILDTFALFWGTFMLYLYLTGRDTLLLVSAAAGIFIFPVLFFIGSMLYLFPHNPTYKRPVENTKFARLVTALQGRLTKRFNTLLFFLVSCGFIASFAYMYFIMGYRQKAGANSPDFNVTLLMSAACVLLYFYWIMCSIDFRFLLGKLKNELIIKRCYVVLALLLVSYMVIEVRSFHDRPSIYPFFGHVIYESLTNPFVFILSHILYFGPFIILLIMYRKRLVEFLDSQSLGFIFIIYFFLFLGIGSESRQFIMGLPIFIYALFQAINRLQFNIHFIGVFLAASFLFSKIWYRINKVPLTGEYLAFPFQRYFMALGPWMSDQMYYIQGAVALLVLSAFYICSRMKLIKFG
jgi:hypothetical protein